MVGGELPAVAEILESPQSVGVRLGDAHGLESRVAGREGLSIEKLPSMPYGLAYFVGRMLEGVWALTRRAGDPPLSRSMVRMIGREFTTSDAAARRELGYEGKARREAGSAVRYP